MISVIVVINLFGVCNLLYLLSAESIYCFKLFCCNRHCFFKGHYDLFCLSKNKIIHYATFLRLSFLEENATLEESVKLYESCIVELTPGLPINAPIEITFNLDANGILVITAVDLTNNVSKEVTPVRIGGDVDDIGMDVISGTVLR